MAGTGSYNILCIEYTLHYNVTSLVPLDLRRYLIRIGVSYVPL
jgi:hypothetical protein